jgi:hypothetical protein
VNIELVDMEEGNKLTTISWRNVAQVEWRKRQEDGAGGGEF